MNLYDLPKLNALLNVLTTLLLITGWLFIRRRNKRGHITCMVSALCTSTLFLTSYLIYHAQAGSIRFTETGWPRTIYFFILLTHTVLAAIVLPLVVATVIPAVKKKWKWHRKIARWTLPVWLYVSVTGVLVYLMLYVWFPSKMLLERLQNL